MSRIQQCLCTFCNVVGQGTEEGEVFADIRTEVQGFLGQTWAEEGDAAVKEYMVVPNHRFACTDLDYKRFTPAPLMVGGRPLHLHHILEAFSRTNPQRYACVWAPLLDLAEVTGAADTACLQGARSHLSSQQQQQQQAAAAAAALAAGMQVVPTATTTPPSSSDPAAVDPQLDSMMQNVLTSFPGLQSMVQQLVSGSATEDGMGQMLGQIQGLLTPLLSQAATTASQQDPSLQPAIGQILSGFSALTQALTTPPSTSMQS